MKLAQQALLNKPTVRNGTAVGTNPTVNHVPLLSIFKIEEEVGKNRPLFKLVTLSGQEVTKTYQELFDHVSTRPCRLVMGDMDFPKSGEEFREEFFETEVVTISMVIVPIGFGQDIPTEEHFNLQFARVHGYERMDDDSDAYVDKELATQAGWYQDEDGHFGFNYHQWKPTRRGATGGMCRIQKLSPENPPDLPSRRSWTRTPDAVLRQQIRDSEKVVSVGKPPWDSAHEEEEEMLAEWMAYSEVLAHWEESEHLDP
jgi:hypothetical protein